MSDENSLGDEYDEALRDTAETAGRKADPNPQSPTGDDPDGHNEGDGIEDQTSDSTQDFVARLRAVADILDKGVGDVGSATRNVLISEVVRSGVTCVNGLVQDKMQFDENRRLIEIEHELKLEELYLKFTGEEQTRRNKLQWTRFLMIGLVGVGLLIAGITLIVKENTLGPQVLFLAAGLILGFGAPVGADVIGAMSKDRQIHKKSE